MQNDHRKSIMLRSGTKPDAERFNSHEGIRRLDAVPGSSLDREPVSAGLVSRGCKKKSRAARAKTFNLINSGLKA